MGLRQRFHPVAVELIIALAKSSGLFNSFFGGWRRYFNRFEEAGLHMMPAHYYSPVPDTRELNDALWHSDRTIAGFDMEAHGGAAFLRDVIVPFASELSSVPQELPAEGGYHFNNPAFVAGDAAALYGVIRATRPGRIVEIGSGYSSLVIDLAIAANRRQSDYAPAYQSIDPYPRKFLGGMVHKPEIITSRVQDIPLTTFDALESGDVLFIDSTHVARIGSDVVYEILEILPRLKPGVLIHLHDIFLPREYPEGWTKTSRFFWNEQYPLQAFLAFNDRFEILWPANLMHQRMAPELARMIPG